MHVNWASWPSAHFLCVRHHTSDPSCPMCQAAPSCPSHVMSGCPAHLQAVRSAAGSKNMVCVELPRDPGATHGELQSACSSCMQAVRGLKDRLWKQVNEGFDIAFGRLLLIHRTSSRALGSAHFAHHANGHSGASLPLFSSTLPSSHSLQRINPSSPAAHGTLRIARRHSPLMRGWRSWKIDEKSIQTVCHTLTAVPLAD